MSHGDRYHLIGTTIDGKYRVDSVLGEGGFGVVYAGFHLVIGQPVAIKCIRPTGATQVEEQLATESFLREARVLFAIAHASIVRMYDVGSLRTPYGTLPYVVLERVEGVSLEAEIEKRQRGQAPHFSPAEIGMIFDPVLDAIAFAHERGVAHRDLKPSNVMLQRGLTGVWSAKILDFGTARYGGSNATSAAGAATGFTPRYAAPEQWDASLGPAGTATDVFALGLILAEACTLVPVIRGDGIAQVVAASMNASRSLRISEMRSDLPRTLDAVFEQATRTNPFQRFPTAREMAIAFRAAMTQSQPVHAPSYAPAPMGYGPPGAMMPYGAPQGRIPVGTTAPPRSTPASSSSSVLLILGVLGLAVVMAAIIALAAGKVLHGSDEPAPSAIVAAPSDVPPASSSAAVALAPTPAAPRATSPRDAGKAPAPAASVAPSGKTGAVLATGVTGEDPFWTKKELVDVVEAHIGELNACYARSLARDATLAGPVDIIVDPGTSGIANSPMCSLRQRRDAEADALCLCFSSSISGWRFPKPHGRLGALTSASFIYELALKP